MLAKMTLKNQPPLPRRAVNARGSPSQVEVEVDGDRLVLAPARPGAAGEVRQNLRALGLTHSDVADAVAWARRER